MLIDILSDLYDLIYGLMVTVPPDNTLAQFYNLINTVVLAVLALLGNVAQGVVSIF